MDGAMFSKILIQFSVDRWACFPSLFFDLRPNYGGVMKIIATSFKKSHAGTASSVPETPQKSTADLHLRLPDTHRQVWVSLFWGHCSFLLGPGVHKVLFVPSKSLFPLVQCKLCNQIPLASKVKFPVGSQSLCQIPRLGNVLWVLQLS